MAENTMPIPLEQSGEPGAMTDSELAAVLAGHEMRSVGYFSNEIASEQETALNYYYGIMDDVPAEDGGSTVVDHTVSITIDNYLSSVLKPFVSSDEVVRFDPRGKEDEEMAEQATEYVNYIINTDNPGFLIFHTWFKDAGLQKLGVVKAWWEDKSRHIENSGVVDAMGLMQAREHEGYLDEADNGDGTFTVKIREYVQDGKVCVENIPPEEFKISPFSRTVANAPYVAHYPSDTTRSDLLEMGFDPDIVEELPASKDADPQREMIAQARYRDEDWFTGSRDMIGRDKSQDLIALRDEYVRIDFDGDGVAELRHVIRVNEVILFNEETDEVPFADLCPVPMPHKVYGRSLADQAAEGQRIGTALLRQTMNNLYKANNPRPEVPETAIGENTIEDLMDGSPGAFIRSKVGGQLQFFNVPFTAKDSFPMLEYTAQQSEARTGIRRGGNGLDRDSLNSSRQMTALQAAQMESRENERAEMIARIYAETGVKRLFSIILKLVVKYQPKARMIRLRNKWVEMDPRGWDPEMDLSVAVGLGTGNRNEQMAQADSILETQVLLAQSPYAWLQTPEHVSNAVKRKYQAAGVKNTEDFIGDPKEMQPPEPQPSPEMAKVQQQAQSDQARLQLDQQKAAAEIDGKREEGALKLQLMREEAAAKLNLERERAIAEGQLARERMIMEGELARERMAMEAEQAERNADRQHKVAMKTADNKIKSNRPGGSLAE